MTGSVYDIDPVALVAEIGILRCNRNAPLLFQIHRIHEAFGNILIFPKYPTLFEHLVYQRGFSMINMGDNGDISDFALIHLAS